MIKELFELLKQDNLTISSAESITGGRFASLIVEEAGASNFLKGSFVCYTNEYKYNVLGVSKDIEIVSEEMARELAINARLKANSDIAISFTGNASPNGIENKVQGLTYIGITNGTITEVHAFTCNETNRVEVIKQTTLKGFELILDFLRKN